jgi:hypothetical protein
MGDVDATATLGVEARGYRRGTLASDPWDQYVIPVEDRIVSFNGRLTTYITPGRAGTNQKIAALHNATGSSVLVCVNRVTVDLLSTAVKAVTIAPPVIRLQRFTAIPTNGTALTKVGLDTSLTSDASVTAWGDATATETVTNAGVGTSAATTLTITAGSTISQKYAPRVFTAVGYEPVDTAPFFHGEPDVILRPLEGLCVTLDQSVTSTGNPTTDKWLAEMDWDEFTRP